MCTFILLYKFTWKYILQKERKKERKKKKKKKKKFGVRNKNLKQFLPFKNLQLNRYWTATFFNYCGLHKLQKTDIKEVTDFLQERS
jgi:hypothetical protein